MSLWLGLACGVERIAIPLIPFQIHIEVFAADQLLVFHLSGRLILGLDDAVGDRQPLGGNPQLLGGQIE